LIDAGFSDDEIKQQRAEFYRFVKIDLILDVITEYNKLVGKKAEARYAKISSEHPQPIKITEKFNSDMDEHRAILAQLVNCGLLPVPWTGT
jgi:hypothetical protein